MDGVDASPPVAPPDVAPADVAPPAAPDTGGAAPDTGGATPAAPVDAFGATPQEQNGAAFAQKNGPDGPAAPATPTADPAAPTAAPAAPTADPAAPATPTAAPANPADADQQVRDRLNTAINSALDKLPGNISDEARAKIQQGVTDMANGAAKALGVPLTALEKAELGFNVNGSVVNGGLSGTVYPLDKVGNWDASLGVSTPNIPGASVSGSLTFKVANGINPEGTPGLSAVVSGKVPGVGDMTFKGGTDGTITVQRDIPGLSVGGGVPNAGVEVNVPLNETARRLTGTTEQDMKWQANQITANTGARSEADYTAQQGAINSKYDNLLKGVTDPGQRAALESERGSQLWNLQRNQVRTDQMIQDIHRQMLQRIEVR